MFIITADTVMDRCWESVQNQDYPNYFVHVNVKEPKYRLGGLLKDKDILDNREDARKKVLAMEADLYLILDSDIVLPKHAISEFVKQMDSGSIKVIAGWVPGIQPEYWVGGYAVDGDKYIRIDKWQPSVTMVDVVPVGCVMVARDVLEKVQFRVWDKPLNVIDLRSGSPHMLYDECCDFSAQVSQMKTPMFLDGDVVCEHLAHNQEEAVCH